MEDLLEALFQLPNPSVRVANHHLRLQDTRGSLTGRGSHCTHAQIRRHDGL